jgi:tetratricopeptide (TPR) repeat protein
MISGVSLVIEDASAEETPLTQEDVEQVEAQLRQHTPQENSLRKVVDLPRDLLSRLGLDPDAPPLLPAVAKVLAQRGSAIAAARLAKCISEGWEAAVNDPNDVAHLSESELYIRAVTLDPTLALGWNGLASTIRDGLVATVGDEQLTEIECLQRALQLDPTLYAAWFNLSEVVRELPAGNTVTVGGTSYTAMGCMQKALSFCDTDSDIWLRIAQLHKASSAEDSLDVYGERFTLRELLKRAIALAPDDSSLWWVLADFLSEAGGTIVLTPGDEPLNSLQCLARAAALQEDDQSVVWGELGDKLRKAHVKVTVAGEVWDSRRCYGRGLEKELNTAGAVPALFHSRCDGVTLLRLGLFDSKQAHTGAFAVGLRASVRYDEETGRFAVADVITAEDAANMWADTVHTVTLVQMPYFPLIPVRNRAAAARLASKVEGGMQVVYPPIAGSENFSPQCDAGVAPTWDEAERWAQSGARWDERESLWDEPCDEGPPPVTTWD